MLDDIKITIWIEICDEGVGREYVRDLVHRDLARVADNFNSRSVMELRKETSHQEAPGGRCVVRSGDGREAKSIVLGNLVSIRTAIAAQVSVASLFTSKSIALFF